MKKSVVSKNIASNFFFWDCPKCSRRNSNVLSECEICGSSSALVDVARGTADDKIPVSETSWNCTTCTFLNTHYNNRESVESLSCEMCGQRSPLSSIIEPSIQSSDCAVFKNLHERNRNNIHNRIILTARSSGGASNTDPFSGDVPSKTAITIGASVYIVKKTDQFSGNLTCGKVKRHLTNSAIHPRGIKVELESGEVGRVQRLA